MTAHPFAIGQTVAYYRTQRGGYCYRVRYDARIERLSPSRAHISYVDERGTLFQRCVPFSSLKPINNQGS